MWYRLVSQQGRVPWPGLGETVLIRHRCRYASLPGEPLLVQEGEGALLARVDTAIVLRARLTGLAVGALWMGQSSARF